MSDRPEKHETSYSEHADESAPPQPPAPDNADPDAPTEATTAFEAHADESEAPHGPEADAVDPS